VGKSELAALKIDMAKGSCFRRLRGALCLVTGIWENAYDTTAEVAFKVAAKHASSALSVLNAVTHALPAQASGMDDDSFGTWQFSRLEELPPELLEALQQLGPL